jgi:hypothetical protein
MKFITTVALTLATLSPLPCVALETEFHSLADLPKTERERNVAKEDLPVLEVEPPNFDCPVCVDSDGGGGKLIQQILSNAHGLMAKSASFTRLKRSLRTLRGRRQYNKKIAKDSIVPILQISALHFDKFAIKARSFATTTAPQPSPLEKDMFAVLESVANTSASVLSEIANVIQTSDTVTAGLVTTSIISVLGYFELGTLQTTAALVDHIHALTGESTSSTSTVSQGDSANVGVFDDVLDFLSSQRDKSGLSPVLVKLTGDMKVIDSRLSKFVDDANTLITTSSSSGSTNVALSDATVASAAQLVVGVEASVINLVAIVAGTPTKSVGSILRSVSGLIVQSVSAILSRSTSTFNSVLAALEMDTSAKDTPVSGDILYYVTCLYILFGTEVECLLISVLLWILSPIWVPLLIVTSILQAITGSGGLRTTTTSKAKDWLSCQMGEFSCKNNVLSNALSAI